MKIALVGPRAGQFADAFSGHSCRLLESERDLSTEDDVAFAVSLPAIIPPEILQRPKHGVWVNHSTDLPKGRGWAPLQWSVLNGLDEITVTLFRADSGADTGPFAFKATYSIEPTDTLASLRAKDAKVSRLMFQNLVSAIESGALVLHEQKGEPTYWRKRTAEDARLDASRPLSELWDHIRVCDNEDYPAYFEIDGKRVYLRYEVRSSTPERG
jgi:methionyl-tRNA formyltransferase